MSKLNIDQQTVYQLFSDKKADFLIPDYQRPYAWGDTECLTLWEDIFSFAFPNDDCDAFRKDDEYFLGPIVTFKNEGKQEIIDGQQRLTTLMLMLRAFYTKFLNMQDKNSVSIRNSIAKCIWKSDEFDNLIADQLKIDSQVSTDEDKGEFMDKEKVLRHENRKPVHDDMGGFVKTHEQFRKKMGWKEVVDYIYRHDQWRLHPASDFRG